MSIYIIRNYIFRYYSLSKTIIFIVSVTHDQSKTKTILHTAFEIFMNKNS